MPASGGSEGDEVVAAALAGIRDITRQLGKRGLGFTPPQLEELLRATRTLLNTIDFKLRLAGSANR